MAELVGEPTDVVALVRQDERQTRARTTRAAGPPDPVDVIVLGSRRVEVDHVRDSVDIEAAGRDVGRDQRRHAAGSELGERALPGVLRHVSVQDDRRHAVLARELPRNLVGAVLGADEDERQFALTLELQGELGKLVLERDRVELVGDLAEPDVLAVSRRGCGSRRSCTHRSGR